MKAWIVWPFSSFTRKVEFGRFSSTSPCISMTSSLAISARLPDGQPALEARLSQQALVLVGHDVRLHLGHEVHRHHDDDEERRAAKTQRPVPAHYQESRQQAAERHVDRS